MVKRIWRAVLGIIVAFAIATTIFLVNLIWFGRGI
jgi:hypothetical protein